MAQALKHLDSSDSPETLPAKTVGPESFSEAAIRAFFDGAERGDGAAMRTLRPWLAEIPQWEEHYLSPVGSARLLLLQTVVRRNLLAQEAWERRVHALEQELAGPHPSPLERMLCERIATCWLDAHLADIMCAEWLRRDGSNFKAGEFYSRRQERANARFVGAVQALARVRRLLAPPLVAQVNIAQPGAQQLNIAAPTTPNAPNALMAAPTGDPHEATREAAKA